MADKMEKENFGLPKVDYTPIGSIEMEGKFLRGLTDTKKSGTQ